MLHRLTRAYLLLLLTVAAFSQVVVTTGGNSGAVPPPVPNRSPSKPEDLASMEGRVTDSLTGEPVRKARLFFDGRVPGLSTAYYSIATDDNGNYLAKGMEPSQ